MFKKNQFNHSFLALFVKVLLIYIGFWFLLRNLNTDGIWETVVLSVLFFLIFPSWVLKEKVREKLKIKFNLFVVGQSLLIWLLFAFFAFQFDFFAFLKLNYLIRVDLLISDWWAIVFLDLILIPIILFSQEFFFRGFLIERFRRIWPALLIQAVLFTGFEMLFFEFFTWQFVLFSFLLALLLGGFYLQTRSIWYSFITRWVLILILDGSLLYKIQQLKS